MSKLRVLMYHKVSPGRPDFLTLTPEQLNSQLHTIQKHYSPVSLSMVCSHIDHGTPLPSKAVLLTFDDGYLNNFEWAFPLLQALNMPFAVFPVAGFTGQTLRYDGYEQSFMSRDQLMAMSGLAEYGYHGFEHLNFNRCTETERLYEISRSVEKFAEMQLPVQGAWAYTYGAFPKKNKAEFSRLKDAFRSAGIGCAFRIGNRLNSLPLKDPYRIERIDVRGNESMLRFRFKLAFGKLL